MTVGWHAPLELQQGIRRAEFELVAVNFAGPRITLVMAQQLGLYRYRVALRVIGVDLFTMGMVVATIFPRRVMHRNFVTVPFIVDGHPFGVGASDLVPTAPHRATWVTTRGQGDCRDEQQ